MYAAGLAQVVTGYLSSTKTTLTIQSDDGRQSTTFHTVGLRLTVTSTPPNITTSLTTIPRIRPTPGPTSDAKTQGTSGKYIHYIRQEEFSRISLLCTEAGLAAIIPASVVGGLTLAVGLFVIHRSRKNKRRRMRSRAKSVPGT